MIKIYVPKIEKYEVNKTQGEINHILKDGIILNERTELVDSFEECDYVFADHRHLNSKSGYDTSKISEWSGKKLIVVDYSDNAKIFDVDCLHYFKRSSVIREGEGSFRTYPRRVRPISYCVKNNWLDFNTDTERDIDISVFFRQSHERNKPLMSNREKVAEFVANRYKDKNIHVGIVDKDGEAGRMNIGKEYLDKMLRSKIVVNCNPDEWEGDYRLFETLSCGAMVLVDKMITPVVNPFQNRKHLVYYHSLKELGEVLDYYLSEAGDSERQRISQNGYEYALKYHKTSDRIDEILKVVEDEKYKVGIIKAKNGSDLLTVNDIVAGQTPKVVFSFSKIIPKFDNIIEIGTSLGAFTLLLDKFRKEGSNLTTWEISRKAPRIKEYGIDIRYGDVFTFVNQDSIKQLLQQEGRSILLCDGGYKNDEVKVFSEFLKPKDVIMCHDFMSTKTEWQKVTKSLNWKFNPESHLEFIQHTMSTQNLKPWYHKEFRQILWGSFIKK